VGDFVGRWDVARGRKKKERAAVGGPLDVAKNRLS